MYRFIFNKINDKVTIVEPCGLSYIRTSGTADRWVSWCKRYNQPYEVINSYRYNWFSKEYIRLWTGKLPKELDNL